MKLTTGEFAREFCDADFQATPVKVWDDVDLHPNRFGQLVEDTRLWHIVESSDGRVSHVFEDPRANVMDHSHTTDYFGLHTDGQYLEEIPPRCLLYAVDAGTGGTPTVFADSRQLVRALYDTGAIDDAREFDFIYTKKEGTQFRRPLIERNPLTNEEIMCVVGKSRPVRLVPSPDSLKTEREATVFFDTLSRLAVESMELLVHHWKTDQVVVFDNMSLVHGRGLSAQEKIATDTERHLVRMWIGEALQEQAKR